MRLVKSMSVWGPVTATIILTTVAAVVSIVWSGGHTFTFIPWEQLEIVSCTFNDGPPKTVTLHTQILGTTELTINQYKIGVQGTPTDLDSSVTVTRGATANIFVPLNWSTGETYDIYLLAATGEQFLYRARAPEQDDDLE